MTHTLNRRVVAVVGGGIAGVVAARDLALRGVQVSLIEREPLLGGRVRALPLAGHPTDVGAESFATRDDTIVTLIAELGLTDQIVHPASHAAWIYTGGRAFPFPPGGALGIPAHPLRAETRHVLGFVGALRAAAEPFLGRGASLPGNASLAEVVRTRLGERVLERLVRPVTLGVYSSDPADLPFTAIPGLAEAYEREKSLTRASLSLRDAARAAGSAVASLRGGMTRLSSALEEDLERLGVSILRGTHVTSIRHADPRTEHSRTWSVQGQEGRPLLSADAIVVAVGPVSASKLLGDTTAPARFHIEVIALAVTDERLDAAPRGTGVLVAPDASGAEVFSRPNGSAVAKALTHATAKWPDRAELRPPSEHVLRLSYGRPPAPPETADLSDARAFDLALRDASTLLGVPLQSASVRDAVRQLWPVHAPPNRAAGIPEPLPDGVTIVGDGVHGTGLSAVVRDARRSAHALVQWLQ